MSYSKLNIYPQKYLQQYLEDTYEGNFTFISQEYFITSDRKNHVWKLLFSDEQEVRFYEYLYLTNTGYRLPLYKNDRDALFVRYEFMWDTYTQVHLEEEYFDKVDFEFIRNKKKLCDTRIESHYVIVIENESDIEKAVSILSLLYFDTLHYAKNAKIITLICGIYRSDDDIICIITPNSIKEALKTDFTDNSLQGKIQNHIREVINKNL
jgi:hypothetical protein